MTQTRPGLEGSSEKLLGCEEQVPPAWGNREWDFFEQSHRLIHKEAGAEELADRETHTAGGLDLDCDSVAEGTRGDEWIPVASARAGPNEGQPNHKSPPTE
jgi:hypothetical protein